MNQIKGPISAFRTAVFTSIANLAAVKIRWWWLIVVSVLLHRLPFAVLEPQSFVELKQVSQILSYVFLLWALAHNLYLWSFRIMLLGSLLNFITIAANGGLMPVSPEARQLAGMVFLGQEYFGMVLPEGSGVLLPVDQTNLWILTDVLPVVSIRGVVSVGDVLIVIGLFTFLVEAICLKNKEVRPTAFPNMLRTLRRSGEIPEMK